MDGEALAEGAAGTFPEEEVEPCPVGAELPAARGEVLPWQESAAGSYPGDGAVPAAVEEEGPCPADRADVPRAGEEAPCPGAAACDYQAEGEGPRVPSAEGRAEGPRRRVRSGCLGNGDSSPAVRPLKYRVAAARRNAGTQTEREASAENAKVVGEERLSVSCARGEVKQSRRGLEMHHNAGRLHRKMLCPFPL